MGGGERTELRLRNHGVSPPKAKKTLRNRGTRSPFCFLNAHVPLYLPFRHRTWRSPRAPRGASKGVAMADKDTKKKATVLDMSKRAPMLEKSPIPLGLGLR